MAYYVSFRSGPEWGIYLSEGGLAALSASLFRRSGASFEEAVACAISAVLLHEYGHLLIDVAGLHLERSTGRVFVTHSQLDRAQRRPSWDLLEEALCNAFAMRNLRLSGSSARSLRSAVRAMNNDSPEGHRDYGKYLARPAFDRGIVDLFSHRVTAVGLGASVADSAPLLIDDKSLLVRPGDVPVYIIRDRNLLPETPYFFFITALGDILESKAFTKALRSMPAQVRRAWHERKQMLATNVREAGGHFEALQGKLKSFWSVRVSGQYRVLLQPENGHWRAIKIGTHDEVYR